MKHAGILLVGGGLLLGGLLLFRNRRDSGPEAAWSKKVTPQIRLRFGTDSFAAAANAHVDEVRKRALSKKGLYVEAAWWVELLGDGQIHAVDIFEREWGPANSIVIDKENPDAYRAVGTYYEFVRTMPPVPVVDATDEDIDAWASQVRKLGAALDGDRHTDTPVAPNEGVFAGTADILGEDLGAAGAAVGNGLASVATGVGRAASGLLTGLGKGFAEGAGGPLIVFGVAALAAVAVLR